jgi:hypothetical protein
MSKPKWKQNLEIILNKMGRRPASKQLGVSAGTVDRWSRLGITPTKKQQARIKEFAQELQHLTREKIKTTRVFKAVKRYPRGHKKAGEVIPDSGKFYKGKLKIKKVKAIRDGYLYTEINIIYEGGFKQRTGLGTLQYPDSLKARKELKKKLDHLLNPDDFDDKIGISDTSERIDLKFEAIQFTDDIWFVG